MRKSPVVLLLCFILFLIGCKGSDVYQGNWKATDNEGNRFEINFEPKRFTVKETNGNATQYDYTQNSVKIENSIKSYGIKLSDGRAFTILFPVKDDTGRAVITLENNEPFYTMSRTAYIQYDDLYKLTK